MSKCTHIYKSGKQKGKLCDKECNGNYCLKHTVVLPLNSGQFIKTIDMLQFKLLNLDTTIENKRIIEKKFSYIETLPTASIEYQKNLNWLRHALNFPFNKMIKTHVNTKNHVENNQKVSNYVTSVYDKLDSYIYGMPDVKEELMSFVCKKISNPDSNDHILALHGSNGVGKCFLKDTEIRMFNESVKFVQDIQVNDEIMGDDYTKRTVTNLGSGNDVMFKITHIYTNETYTVNKDHILCLMKTDSPLKCLHETFSHINEPFEISVVDYLSLTLECQSLLNGYTTHNKYATIVLSPIRVEDISYDDYYGFTLDNNERFILANNVITHNTRLAHGLAEALDLPIKTVNLGSITDVSFFTGHGFTYVDSEPGRIVQILNETQCKNCIIYFDELDKIHQTEKGHAIYAFLTHLIDTSQNTKFQDVYLSGLDLDVSKVFFVFSFNNIDLVDATVKDRLKIIKIKDPSNVDKVCIAEKFIIPEICKNINFSVNLEKSIIEKIVYLNKEKSGLRGIRRILEDIIAKLNVIRMLDEKNRKKMSFYDVSIEAMIDKIIEKNTRSENETFLHIYS